MDKNPQKIQNMFNQISSKYDFMNDAMSLFLHRYIKLKALNNLDVKPEDTVLDCCCGTGDIVKILKKMMPNLEIIGVDFSDKMLDLAKKKVPNGKFILADCTKLPFKEDMFNVLTIFFGLRNIENYEVAIKEMKRVLKPGGKLCHLDICKNSIFNKFFDKIVYKLAKIFLRDFYPYTYLIESKNEFFEPNEIVSIFSDFGFVLKKQERYLMGMITMQVFETKL